MIKKPKPTTGLHHVALYAENFEACAHFYTEIMGMKVVWQPDADNLYLSSGTDNLALHRAPNGFKAAKDQRLDHIGFFLNDPQEVDVWFEFLIANQVEIKAKPKDHRDGTRSCYCADPDGNVVQIIYYPMPSVGQ